MNRFALLAVAACLACTSSSGSSTDGGSLSEAGVAADAAVAPDAHAADAEVDAAAPAADGAAVPADTAAPADTLPADAAPAAGGACSTRKGGALVTFGVCTPAQRLTVWITAGAFIDEAIAKKGQKSRIPVMELASGADCDPHYPWHVKPDTAQFADQSTEVCDACPNLVDLRNKYYCPWSASVIDVVDQR